MVAIGLGHPQIGAVPAILAVTLVWIATRPLHPPVPALYRLRVRSAWDDWLDALDRWNDRADPRAFAETERATAGLVDRLRATKPPRADRAEHEDRIAALTDYARALEACHAALLAQDEPALTVAIDRLHAARDALG